MGLSPHNSPIHNLRDAVQCCISGRFRATYPIVKTTNTKATKTAYPIFCQIVNTIPTQFIAGANGDCWYDCPHRNQNHPKNLCQRRTVAATNNTSGMTSMNSKSGIDIRLYLPTSFPSSESSGFERHLRHLTLTKNTTTAIRIKIQARIWIDSVTNQVTHVPCVDAKISPLPMPTNTPQAIIAPVDILNMSRTVR